MNYKSPEQKMQRIKVSPSLEISYRHQGDVNPPVVFLHAFPLSSAMWQGQIEEFSSDFEVFAPDFRGIGHSSPFDLKPSLATLATDLAAWLEEIGVYDAVVLCGLSMGGYVALEFARQFPEKLRALILCDTRADADSVEAIKSRNEMIEFAKSSNGRSVAQKMMPRLLGESTQRDNPRAAQKIKEIASANSGESLAKLVAAMRDRRDSQDFLPQIQVPTLVLGGDEDIISPPQVMAGMALSIPNARHVTIAGAGHMANIEKPADFNRELRSFLNEIA